MVRIGILEDDHEGRIPAFRKAAEALGAEAVVHDNTSDFLGWLGGALDSLALLSLDHDLGPSRERDGERFEPGTGKDVVEFLTGRPPSCPVIVHSSNPYDAPVMEALLQAAGWTVRRVHPVGDDWIGTAWLERVRELLGR